MQIGVDGNEANVQNRVGSGTYAFELLRQFAKTTQCSSSESSNNSTSREVTTKSRIFSKESSRQARTIKFTVYLKDQPLPDLPKETENFKYVVFGPKKLWTQFALPLKLKFGPKIDVLFSPAHYGPRFSRVPYVITIHDLSYLHYPAMFKKDDLYQLTSWSKYSIKNATYIIAVSKTTKDDIVRNYGIDPAKITVTYEGYDESRFKPQSKSKVESVKSKYKIKGDHIIFVGTLQPRKNLKRLIEAFNDLKFEIGNLKLVIVGRKGWMYDQIFQKVKDLNLESKVIFTDYVPDDDLPALISGAKAYVNPSLWEGFGIPVIEAQACGVPVVVSNTSSLPEIVGVEPNTPGVGSDSPGVEIPSRVILSKAKDLDSSTSFQSDKAMVSGSGILVNPKSIDSITSGIKKALDPKIRADLVSRGYQNIKRFSWQNCAQQTLKVLVKAANP